MSKRQAIDKRWQLAPAPSEAMRQQFSQLPPLVLGLLQQRSLTEPAAVEQFLNPDYETGLHDPALFKDMAPACQLVWDTLTAGLPLVVFSDYDADGVTGATLLVSLLRELAEKLGQDPTLVHSYIPHREKEGYGLRPAAVDELTGQGMKLMITVDCGIGSAPEVAQAQAAGCEVIVVDHHAVPETVPDCLILHPGAPGEQYPFKKLAAVGVAFKFGCGLLAFARERGLGFPVGHEKWLLDLVAIATVTDVVPLLGENRVLEKYGLIVLNKTRRPGLKQLIEVSGLKPGQIDTFSIGFGIGPRINAASRLEHASMAFDCLMAPDEATGRQRAEDLNRVNQERQRLTEQLTNEATVRATAAPDQAIQVIAGEDWPAGVVGIIAGRLASNLGRPAFVFGQDGDTYVGSGRSIPQFDIMTALEHTKGWLERYGGHPQACGLTIIGEDNYHGFLAAVREFAAKELAGEDLRPVLYADAEIQASEVTWEAVEWLAKFEPFGEANPKPRFLMRNLEVASVACVGKDNQHVRLGLRGDKPTPLKAIGFRLAERALNHPPGSRIDAIVELGVNEWNGRRELQVKLVDIAAVGAKLSAVKVAATTSDPVAARAAAPSKQPA
jgi:single-stranded-DNA-specific exonuclease